MDINTERAIEAYKRLERAKRRVEKLQRELEVALYRQPIDTAEYVRATSD